MDDLDFGLHAMYRIYDAFDRPLYFGETDNLPRRLAQHMEKAWFRRPDITIKVTWFPNRAEAYAAQNRAIATEKPWYNKAGLESPKKVPEQAPPVAIRPQSTAPPKPKAAKPRDLLADLDRLLGDKPVRLSGLAHLLRQLAPECEPYQKLNGVTLRAMLADRGIRTTNRGNVPRLDPADLRRVDVKKAG